MIGAPHGTARPRRRLWRSRCVGLVAVPVSIGPATLVLEIGTSSFCTRRLTVAQKFSIGC
jgi:hypothetical protein